MIPTPRQLAIMANTLSIYLTGEEQRLADSFAAGVYERPCPFRSKQSKLSYLEGLKIAAEYNWFPKTSRIHEFLFGPQHGMKFDYRHPELDQ